MVHQKWRETLGVCQNGAILAFLAYSMHLHTLNSRLNPISLSILKSTLRDSRFKMTTNVDLFPTSTSSLLLPHASQSISCTLTSLKRSTLSITNRLYSIHRDSIFVQDISSSLNLPLIANERCGSWYVPPERKSGSAYFKSTDGHCGQWRFSMRRLNLQILDIIGESGGWVRDRSFNWVYIVGQAQADQHIVIPDASLLTPPGVGNECQML